MPTVRANHVVEWTFTARNSYADPFNEVTLDVLVASPDGDVRRIPAFWDGGGTWKARYASSQLGIHAYRTLCSDPRDKGLNGVTGEVEVVPYTGSNPLYRHGPVGVAEDRRHFAHADGTPFFWLADTWWMGLCKRLEWPAEFQQLTKDRVQKGFTVIQIVAGLYPDMPAFDERGANEAGFPWTKDYSSINPAYFQAADRRIAALMDAGLAPCIVGAWGYYLPWMGIPRMEQHWRYLIARYGAYPVFWCVAGEANLPYYLAKGFPYDDRQQVAGWTEVARYVRAEDPYHRLLSIHPTGLGKLTARGAIDDVSLLDFDMLQTGHGDRSSLDPTVRTIRSSYEAQPTMPVLDSEVCYEGILNACHADVQRLMFWSCMLSGAAGHTYGANGIWELNRPGRPYGQSPHGGTYGPTPWQEAMRLPGSRQLGLAKRLLEQQDWTRLTPLPGTASYEAQPPITWGSWIWYPEGDPAVDAPAEPRWFRRSFWIPEDARPIDAVLRLAVDDRATVYLNGRRIGVHTGWKPWMETSVAPLLRHGLNMLAVRAENLPAPVSQNPAGLLCGLEIHYADGKVENVLSDGKWAVANRQTPGWTSLDLADEDWPRARVVAPYGAGPWGKLEADEPFLVPYCAGTEHERIIYVPQHRPIRLTGLRPRAAYRAEFVDPTTCRPVSAREVTIDASGEWTPQPPPTSEQDWLLILERK